MSLRDRLATGRLLIAPGVFDMISLRIANEIGFEAVYMTGYGAVASALGLPDAGLATYTDMLNSVARMAQVSKAPLIADGDTGYGGLLNVRHTVRGYEQAGAAAIQLEDQEFPKRCGHTPGRRVVASADMVDKIRVAVDARGSREFLVIARTDARGPHGLDEALRRGDQYLAAGADILFIEGPENGQEVTEVGRRFAGRLMMNIVDGGSTPPIEPAELESLGYVLVIYPATAFLAAGQAIEHAYAWIRNRREPCDEGPHLYDFSRFTRLMGFQDVWDFEQRYSRKEK